MSSPLDEQTAWNLVRAVPLALAGQDSARVRHDSRPDVWLQVHASGRWETSAELTHEAHDVLELYVPLQLRADLVIAQLGQSLDGRIATESGHSHYVTGQADIRRLHRLRALVDAVVVGASTVAADNPRLTVRQVEGENPGAGRSRSRQPPGSGQARFLRRRGPNPRRAPRPGRRCRTILRPATS